MRSERIEELERQIAEELIMGVRDRMDALVWAMLMGDGEEAGKRYGVEIAQSQKENFEELKRLREEEYEENQALVRYLEDR